MWRARSLLAWGIAVATVAAVLGSGDRVGKQTLAPHEGKDGDAAKRVAAFSVNVPGEESDLTRVPLKGIEALFGPRSLAPIDPKASIRAEPYVAWVDANVDRQGTRAAAEAYLRYLYTEEAQEVIARHFYRPIDDAIPESDETAILTLSPRSTYIIGSPSSATVTIHSDE